MIPEDLEELPPSAKLVYIALEAEDELTQKDIVEWTQLRQRTVREALTRLEENGILTERPNYRDARQSYYRVEV